MSATRRSPSRWMTVTPDGSEGRSRGRPQGSIAVGTGERVAHPFDRNGPLELNDEIPDGRSGHASPQESPHEHDRDRDLPDLLQLEEERGERISRSRVCGHALEDEDECEHHRDDPQRSEVATLDRRSVQPPLPERRKHHHRQDEG